MDTVARTSSLLHTASISFIRNFAASAIPRQRLTVSADGDSLSVSVLSQPQRGSLVLATDGSFTYTPGPTFAGLDAFSYWVSDGLEGASATVVLTSAPVAGDDAYLVIGGTTFTAAAPGVLANDSGPGGTLTASLDSGPADGTLALASDGSFTYVPTTGFYGNDTFTYQAVAGGVDSATTEVMVSVVPQVSLVAHQAGTLSAPGTAESDSDAQDPDNLPMVVADDPTAAITASTDGLVELTLKSLASQGVTSGVLTLRVSDPTAVRLFKADGTPLTDYSVDLASPSGDLAGLATADVNVFVQAVEPDTTDAGEEFELIYAAVDPMPKAAADKARDGGRGRVVAWGLDSIDFKNGLAGGGNVPIYAGLTASSQPVMIGSRPGSFGNSDVEYYTGRPGVPGRTQPDTQAAWNTTQIAPIANVAGDQLRVLLTFVVSEEYEAIFVKGTNAGAYGNFPEVELSLFPVPAINGYYQYRGTLVSVAARTTVGVDTLNINWQVTAYLTADGVRHNIPGALGSTIPQRVYTLNNQPQPGIGTARPIAPLLELATGIANNLFTLASIRAALTVGINRSKWTTFATSARFLNPQAVLEYIIGLNKNTLPDRAAASETYDLLKFLSNVQSPTKVTFQQCDDNANLLAIMSRSLGVPIDLVFVKPELGVLRAAPFYPAGKTQGAPANGIVFAYHQVAIAPIAVGSERNAVVYDPSITSSLIGGYFRGNMTLAQYLLMNFPGGQAVEIGRVTSLSIGPVLIGAFAFAAGPSTVRKGGAAARTTTITVKGFGFNSLIGMDSIRVTANSINGVLGAKSGTFFTVLKDVTVENLVVVDDQTLNITLKVDNTVAPGRYTVLIRKFNLAPQLMPITVAEVNVVQKLRRVNLTGGFFLPNTFSLIDKQEFTLLVTM